MKKVKLKVNWFNMVECVHKMRLILTTARACDIQTVAFYEEKWKLLFDILIKIPSSPPTPSIRATFSISTLFCLLRNSFSCPEGCTYYSACKCQRSLLPYGVIFWSAWTVFALFLGNSNYASTYFIQWYRNKTYPSLTVSFKSIWISLSNAHFSKLCSNTTWQNFMTLGQPKI